MTTITLRFINTTGIIGRGINWVTNSLWSHVEIMTDAGTWIGAHSSGGVQERAADYCKPSLERRYAIPVTQAQHDAILAYAKAKIGVRYDLSDIVGLALHVRKIRSPHLLICSEFVLMATEAGDLSLLNVLPGWEYLVTPETLHLSPRLKGHCVYSFPAELPVPILTT